MAIANTTLDSLGIKLSVATLGDFGLVPAMTEVVGVTAMTGPNSTANERQLTTFTDESHTSKPGKPKYGEVSVTMFDIPQAPHRRILDKMLKDRETRSFRIESEEKELLAETGATGSAARLVTIAAASATAPARATFSGNGFGTTVDISNFDNLAPGSVIKVGNTAYVIYEQTSASQASVVRLDEAAITAVSTASVFSAVRPALTSDFNAWVASISPTFEVDEELSVEVGLMLSGAPDTTRTVS